MNIMHIYTKTYAYYITSYRRKQDLFEDTSVFGRNFFLKSNKGCFIIYHDYFMIQEDYDEYQSWNYGIWKPW